jgi:hypothetical protein
LYLTTIGPYEFKWLSASDPIHCNLPNHPHAFRDISGSSWDLEYIDRKLLQTLPSVLDTMLLPAGVIKIVAEYALFQGGPVLFVLCEQRTRPRRHSERLASWAWTVEEAQDNIRQRILLPQDSIAWTDDGDPVKTLKLQQFDEKETSKWEYVVVQVPLCTQ